MSLDLPSTPSPAAAAPPGEYEYYRAIGESGREHAFQKPWSDPDVGTHLMQLGALLQLLPPPPADVLECGCGPGWLTKLLARVGYRSIGVDVAPAAIELARSGPVYEGMTMPRFEVAPGEDLPFHDELDAVVYFDALHHVTDERLALAAAHRALRAGGVLITSEPGRGHAEASADTVDAFGVSERDMPARHIAAVAREVGFTSIEIFPRADELGSLLYGDAAPLAAAPAAGRGRGIKRFARGSIAGRSALAARRIAWTRLDNGLVRCTK
jgi:SAM-dependent methyltransferase